MQTSALPRNVAAPKSYTSPLVLTRRSWTRERSSAASSRSRPGRLSCARSLSARTCSTCQRCLRSSVSSPKLANLASRYADLGQRVDTGFAHGEAKLDQLDAGLSEIRRKIARTSAASYKSQRSSLTTSRGAPLTPAGAPPPPCEEEAARSCRRCRAA